VKIAARRLDRIKAGKVLIMLIKAANEPLGGVVGLPCRLHLKRTVRQKLSK